MSHVLDGIRVLEVANWVAVPSACAILADLGAEVIKVEPPGAGDAVRNINVSTRGVVPAQGGLNLAFQQLNRGKRSVAVNLESAPGREAVRKLAARADILATNLIPRRQARYRLTYEEVLALNPRVIYVSLTGYGAEGPEKDRAGFDYAAFWARSGIMSTLGQPEHPPVTQRPGFGDQTTSLALTSAIALALFERERSGRGQKVDLSLLHTGLWADALDLLASTYERRPIQRISRLDVRNPLHNFYRAGDGKWVQVVMVESPRFWEGFCHALGVDHLLHDPRFASHAARAENRQELIPLLDETFASRPRHEWAPLLDQAGCIWAPVQTTDELGGDPQVLANGYLAELSHPEHREFRVLNAPMRFQRTPGVVQGTAPELGEHTEAVLLDLGYSWEEITAMKEEGAII